MIYLIKKDFSLALIISLACHSLLFFLLQGFLLNNKVLHYSNLEVTYLLSSQKSNLYTPICETKDIDKTQMVASKPYGNNLTVDRFTPPEIKTPSYKTKKILNKKTEVKPLVDTKTQNSHGYITYSQLLRAKIKRYVKYPDSLVSGQVYLDFALDSSGKLKMIKINEEESSSNVALRIAALESIKKAAPFPPFPDELNQGEATFKIIISFQNE